jgi:hypothetical protein
MNCLKITKIRHNVTILTVFRSERQNGRACRRVLGEGKTIKRNLKKDTDCALIDAVKKAMIIENKIDWKNNCCFPISTGCKIICRSKP